MSLKQNNNELSRLVGAAIAVLIALPIAAWVGSFIGDSYTARATTYILPVFSNDLVVNLI